MSVYIDTSAFLAVAKDTDEQHAAAAQVWRALLSSGELLITSNYVVIETIALIHSRYGSENVQRFVAGMLPLVHVEFVDPQVHATALSVVVAIPGRSGPSMVDCVSFEMIRKHQVSAVFAYDKHFATCGSTVIG